MLMLLAGSLSLIAADKAPLDAVKEIDQSAAKVDVGPIESGPYEASWKSLDQYECPAWFRDAKFGIFMHWGLPSVADENRPFGTGHYAAGMYSQDGKGQPAFRKDIYAWHVKRYGHPSKFGYKDLIPLWKAEKFDANALVTFYKKIGARYVVPVACHHDNFDIYDSTYHRWNVMKMGPKRDLLGEWQKACEKQGMRFGASSHSDRGPSFLSGSWGSDDHGPLQGVPYDGSDPALKDFYLKGVTPEEWQVNWYKRTKELIDRYHVDLLWFDGPLPYGEVGLKIAAHLYNTNMKLHDGHCEAVLNVKRAPSYKGVILDIERGGSSKSLAYPWQTDTTLIGGWFYHKAQLELTPGVLVGNLIDIVSKNGNLLLNVGLRPDGTLPENQTDILEKLGQWLNVNAEGIYGTRPWASFGEGPTQVKAGAFKEQKDEYTAQDIRFTTKGKTLYAFVLGWPQDGRVVIRSLAAPNAVSSVSLLGSSAPVTWKQTPEGLLVDMPAKKPCEYAWCLRIEGEGLKPVPVP